MYKISIEIIALTLGIFGLVISVLIFIWIRINTFKIYQEKETFYQDYFRFYSRSFPLKREYIPATEGIIINSEKLSSNIINVMNKAQYEIKIYGDVNFFENQRFINEIVELSKRKVLIKILFPLDKKEIVCPYLDQLSYKDREIKFQIRFVDHLATDFIITDDKALFLSFHPIKNKLRESIYSVDGKFIRPFSEYFNEVWMESKQLKSLDNKFDFCKQEEGGLNQ